MTFNVFTILILLGCINGLVLALVLLVHPKFRKTSNSFLALFLSSFSLNNLYYTFYDTGVIELYPFLSMAPISLTFLIAFSFYYFVRFLIEPSYKFAAKDYYFLALVVLQFCFHLINMLFFVVSTTYRTNIYKTIDWLDNTFEEVLAMLIGLVVLILTIIELNNYQTRLKGHYSELGEKSLLWLRNLCFALGGIWALWAIPGIYEIYIGRPTNAAHYPMWIGFSLVVYWIGYSALFRDQVFVSPDFSSVPNSSPNVKSLSSNADSHFERLVGLMEDQNLYRNPKLTLGDLAEETELSPGYLSQIINQKSGSHFFDFVNRYRVEDVQRKFADSAFDHFSLLAIGLEAGFNSKSTFNAVFKEQTGKTPSSYRNNPI